MSEHRDNIIEADTDQQIVDGEDTIVTYDENDTDNEEYHESYETFALSTKELESLVPQVPGTNNVHQIATEQSKEKIASIKNTILMQNDILRMYKAMNRDGNLKLSIETIEGRIKDLTLENEKEEQKLKNIANLRSEFKEKLPYPATFGTVNDINIESARLSIPSFGNNNVGNMHDVRMTIASGQTTISLEEFWHKLLEYAESISLTEEATKKLLGMCLFGEPHRVFFDNKDKSLKEMLQILVDRFGAIHTIADKLKALENISRLEGEKIQATMNRCNILVDATKYLVPENEREMRQNVLMTQNLLKLVKPGAKNAIVAHRASAARAGYNLSYKELLNIAIDVERMESGNEYSAFPAIKNTKFRSHNEKPYTHTSLNKIDANMVKPSIPKHMPTISNPTTQGNQPIQRNDHIFHKPFYNPQQHELNQPRYQNYQNYTHYHDDEQNQYQNRYGNSNKQNTFVQRLDKNQLYQSIPMPTGCPKCGYQTQKKQYNSYNYGNRYQKN